MELDGRDTLLACMLYVHEFGAFEFPPSVPLRARRLDLGSGDGILFWGDGDGLSTLFLVNSMLG